MAKLNVTTEKIPVTVEKDVETFHLTLSKEEAKLLCRVLRKVGGHPDHSDRKYSDSIYDALADQFSPSDYEDHLISGSLMILRNEVL